MSGVNKSHSNNSLILPVPNDIKTRFWGVICGSGLKYNQVVERKYCITHAILDPFSNTNIDEKSSDSAKYVLVMFKYDDDEYIMAVLKHGEIHQVNLNLHFDRENVSFYLKGNGTVHLLGYEILDSVDDSDRINTFSPVSDVIAMPSKEKIKKKSEEHNPKSKSNTVTPKSGKKIITIKESESEEETYSKTFLNKEPKHKIIDLEDEEDEDDEDFSIEEEEEESDDDMEEEIEDSEIEKLEEDLQTMDELPEPSSSRCKRKIEEDKHDKKRHKYETSSTPKTTSTPKIEKVISVEEESPESELSDLEDTQVAETPVVKKVFVSEDKSAQKSKKKKKLKESLKNLKGKDGSKKLNKFQQTVSPVSKKYDGLAIEDLRVGHGPVVAKGKMLHVYYVGRLADKTIFDSRTRGSNPFSFVLGAGKVIKGWEVGLQGMRSGGKRKLTVPPSLGYGKVDLDEIPANSTLYFVIELIAVN